MSTSARINRRLPRYFAELLASNSQEGPHIWSIRDSKLQRLGSDAALVTVRWIARRPDQSLLWDFRDSYLLALEDGQ
ncbi:MAG TPA: hypothetical protein VI094_18010 [Propionibacteriaceae bacterium]